VAAVENGYRRRVQYNNNIIWAATATPVAATSSSQNPRAPSIDLAIKIRLNPRSRLLISPPSPEYILSA